jgi:hypothetical protein
LIIAAVNRRGKEESEKIEATGLKKEKKLRSAGEREMLRGKEYDSRDARILDRLKIIVKNQDLIEIDSEHLWIVGRCGNEQDEVKSKLVMEKSRKVVLANNRVCFFPWAFFDSAVREKPSAQLH